MKGEATVVFIVVMLAVGGGIFLSSAYSRPPKTPDISRSTSFDTATSPEACTPAMTLTQSSGGQTTTEVVTLCRSESTYSGRELGSPVPISTVVTANITIGGAPRAIAIDPTNHRVYVADYFFNNLTVVDSVTDSVVARVSLPANNNNGIAIDYTTNMVYVLVEGGVAVVDGTTNQVVDELHVGFGAGSIAYDPSTQTIYGSSGAGNGTVIGVNARTGETVMNVPIGYWANSLIVDPQTHVVIAAGCYGSFVCNSVVSAVNGITGQVLNRVIVGNDAYPRVAINKATNVVYASGSTQIVALNGSTGTVIYESNSLACGTLDSMAADTSSNQLLAVTLDYNYMMVYDGATGALVNMYSFQRSPQAVAFDSSTSLGYVTMGSQLLVFQTSIGPGHFNSTLTGSGQGCPLP